jgi:hypothetical protein
MATRTADVEALRCKCRFQLLIKPIARSKTSHKENGLSAGSSILLHDLKPDKIPHRDFGLGGFALFFDRLYNALDGRFEEGGDVGSKK